MKIAAVTLAALALGAAAAPAFASSPDQDYIKASRCRGIATGLGATNTAGLDEFLKTQGPAREPFVQQRAQSEFQKARREAAGPDKDRLAAELTGACMAYGGGAKDALGSAKDAVAH